MWVWDEIEMLGKPDNVLLTKWAPQQDILAHPNLKVFVTHAGQSSFQEALCHQKVWNFLYVCISLGHLIVRECPSMMFNFRGDGGSQ